MPMLLQHEHTYVLLNCLKRGHPNRRCNMCCSVRNNTFVTSHPVMLTRAEHGCGMPRCINSPDCNNVPSNRTFLLNRVNTNGNTLETHVKQCITKLFPSLIPINTDDLDDEMDNYRAQNDEDDSVLGSDDDGDSV